MSECLLQLSGVNVHYGMIHALRSLDLKVNRGEIVTILGANGAGKTTTLRTISGLLTPTEGKILYKGHDVAARPAHKIVELGISQSPEGRMVFPDLTVEENLEMGAYLRKRGEDLKKEEEYVFTLFPRLRERLNQLAGTLSGGEQQMLAIGRSIMAKPDLLLLDEPSLGIAPILVATIFKAIEEINKLGTTVLLVEQNAFAALRVAHRAYVMETGAITMAGEAKEMLRNPEIRKAYLGE